MVIEFFAWALALPAIFSLGVFATEVAAGLAPRTPRPRTWASSSAAVLIPAHNEAAGIAATIASVRNSLLRPARILVVADNCSDDTAEQAREAGAEVVERHDPDRRGKGFALAFGRDALTKNPPDAVIILDADCSVMPGSVEALADAAGALRIPVQGINLLSGRLSDPPMVQVSNFAFLVKNLVRARGISRLGGASPLGGTGMAFPWDVFAAAKLASDNIVEDLNLAAELARDGRPAQFIDEARVESPPAPVEATIGQRSRWEHGFIATMRKHAFPILVQGVRMGRWSLIWLGMHLMVPPLTLLILASSMVLAIVGAFAWLFGIWGPAIALCSMLGVAVLFTLIAWAAYGRQTLAPSTLFKMPGYLLWKVPIYAGLLLGKTTGWNRTRRAGE